MSYIKLLFGVQIYNTIILWLRICYHLLLLKILALLIYTSVGILFECLLLLVTTGLSSSTCDSFVFSIFLAHQFLVNVNSRSRLLYAIAGPSVVCLLSVKFVRPTQLIEIVNNVPSPFDTLAIRWHPRKILQRSSQGKPSVGEFKCKRGSQI